jgi:hypothetical protein
MEAAHTTMTALLGPLAVAHDKDECGRRLEWIGWDICLDSRSVTLSERNLLKMVHVFFSFELSAGVCHTHVLRMASLASRLAPLCPFLKPFTRALHEDASHFSPSAVGALRHLSTTARNDVAVWRTFLVIFKFCPRLLARPLETFRPCGPRFSIAYDASLSAVAAGVSALDESGQRSTLLGFGVYTFPSSFGADSSYQNACEFLAILAGFLIARQLGLTHCSATLLGDSVSSLHWATEGRVSSTLARRANIGMALLSLHTGLTTHDTVHVPGIENVTYDGLSRGRTAEQVGLDPRLQFHFSPTTVEARFLQLCDPLLPLTGADAIFSITAALQELLTNR